jgi:ABC-2 type transport system permease protein
MITLIKANPDESPEKQNEVRSKGIPQAQFQYVSKDEYGVQGGFLGVEITMNEKTEIIPVVQDFSHLEYDVTTALLRLSQSEPKVVGILQGNGELGLSATPDSKKGSIAQLTKSLEKLYSVKTVQNTDDKTIVSGVNTLIVAGSENASPETVFAVDQFLTHGGNAVFLLDGVNVDTATSQASIVEKTGFEEILANLGVNINKDLALDQVNENAIFNQGFIQFALPYPLWPKLISQNFDSNTPFMSGVESIGLPWTSSLELNEVEGVSVTTLATTHLGWVMNEPFVLDPQNVQPPADAEPQKIPVLALSKGKYKSIYQQENLPVKLKQGEQFGAESMADGNILIAGSSKFITDNYLNRAPQNLNFIANAIDYLTLGGDIAQIRNKTVIDYSIGNFSESEKTLLKIIAIWLMPVAVSIFGFVHMVRRRKKAYQPW